MVWAIGDIQGCFEAFKQLLFRIDFDPKRDKLWIAGDIVNRGPNSLKTLEYLYSIKESINLVLGNHDIALIAAYLGVKKSNSTIDPILSHKMADKWIKWLREQPFVVIDGKLGFIMSHAGIAPNFDLEDVLKWNGVLQEKLQSKNASKWLKSMMNKKQRKIKFSDDKEYFAFSSFIRMRYVFDKEILEFENKLEPSKGSYKESLKPWFEVKGRKNLPLKVIFGHWSTLGYFENQDVICLDSGCLWGAKLTAKRLDEVGIVQTNCKGI
jgi:bis(5'-nucleosyl)-tetraphosphatase (symmetrical)